MAATMLVGDWLKTSLDCVFPPQCAACEALGASPFCRLCQDALITSKPLELDGFDYICTCFDYGGPAALAIHSLKFERRIDVGQALGQLMWSFVLPKWRQWDIVVPVPSDFHRLCVRGYNPARELARGLPIPSASNILKRTRPASSQRNFGKSQRIKNVQGLFEADVTNVCGASVLIVDDVVTTGATLMACASALRSAGATSIGALVFAKQNII